MKKKRAERARKASPRTSLPSGPRSSTLLRVHRRTLQHKMATLLSTVGPRQHSQKSVVETCVERTWLSPDEASRVKQALVQRKGAIVRVAEEMDAMKQDLPESQRECINRLLSSIDRVLPIFPTHPQSTLAPLLPTDPLEINRNTVTCVKTEPTNGAAVM